MQHKKRDPARRSIEEKEKNNDDGSSVPESDDIGVGVVTGLKDEGEVCQWKKAADKELRKTFLVLNGQLPTLNYNHCILVTGVTYLTPLIFCLLFFSVPQASPFDDEETRKSMMWNMIWCNSLYVLVIGCGFLLFAEALVWQPFLGMDISRKERSLFYICGVIGGNVFFFIGYAIFGNSPPLGYLWLQNGAVSSLASTAAFVFKIYHYDELSVQEKKDSLIAALVGGSIFMMCGVSTMIYFVLTIVYRSIETKYTVDGQVQDKAVFSLLAVSILFVLWKEIFYHVVVVLYKKVNTNMITIGQLWTLFCHAFFMSVLLGGENTKALILVALVVMDLSCCTWAILRLLYCQRKLFADEEVKAARELEEQENQSNNNEIDEEAPEPEKKVTIYSQQNMILKKKERLSQVEIASAKLIETDNPFTKYAMYIVTAELIEALVPCIYLVITVCLNTFPNQKIIGGFGSDKFGYTPVNDMGAVVNNLLILILLEAGTCGLVLVVIWWTFKIHLVKAWVFVCNEHSYIVGVQSTLVVACVMPMVFIPYAMDPYVEFAYLK